MTGKVLEEIIIPGFYETDAIGHINNTVLPMWFEKSRVPLFKIFTPDLDPGKWKLIIVKIEVNYLEQMSYQESVLIKTGVERIGNSSFVVRQEAFQNDILCVRGHTTLVRFNFKENKSQILNSEESGKLEKYSWAID